ncbi:MAG: CheR family methyltransferase [Planctomycetaceae bacterium]
MQDSSTFILKPKEFKLFRGLIYQEAGISLGEGKHQLVESRLSKRLRSLDLTSYQEYYDYLMKSDEDGEERLRMINCLTTNKTDFFREDHHFKYLKSHVFPAIEKRAKETGERKLRIWSAACSTGEEPYTLAMTVLEHFGPMSINGWDIRILASDVDTDVLAHAQKGLYAAERVNDVPRDVLKRCFIRTSRSEESPYQIRPELQELITFRRINFIETEWPIHTVFDAIFCRNVMIYFDEPTQDRLLSRFADVLIPEGHLFIGHSESILRLDRIYKSIGNTVYRLRPGVGGTVRERSGIVLPGIPAPPDAADTPKSIQPELRQSELVVKPLKNSTATKRTDKASRRSTNVKSPAISLANADNRSEVPIRPIIVGELAASATPLRLTTLVGSCIAVCLFDPKYNIGGMNHFMLPCCTTSDKQCATYGIHAMELLVNEIMKFGGDRRRLVAKVFGGGNVLGRTEAPGSIHAIGDRNAEFAMDFLQTDGIPVVAQDIGGMVGRQVHFLTHTGQAFVRPVQGVDENFEQNVRQMKSRVRAPAAESSCVVLF